MLHSPQKQVKDTAGNSNVTSVPTHQKPFRRSNSNASSNGGRQPPQMSVPQGFVAVPPGSHNHNSAQIDHLPRAGFVPNDQPQRRNSFRNRNGGGLQPRGDGSHHFNSGSRRDQDRGNQDWNAHNRNFNNRDNYRSPRFVPQFVRPPPPTNHAQYYPPPPPPIPPYMGSYGYHGMLSYAVLTLKCYFVNYVHALMIICICRPNTSNDVWSTFACGASEKCTVCATNIFCNIFSTSGF